MDYSIKLLQTGQIYQLLSGGITPRPIAWISTQNADGVDNIAPYSFFSVASIQPPILSIAHIAPEAGKEKDTLANLKANGEAVINLVDFELAEKMNASSQSFANNISEFEQLAIEQAPSQNVSVKGVAQAKMRIECRLNRVIDLSEHAAGGQLILLDVEHIYVDDSLLDDSNNPQINLNQFATIGKLGANSYCLTEQRFELQRP